MHRRDFILTTGAAALTPSLAQAASGEPTGPDGRADPAGPAIARGLRELRLTMPWSPELPGFGEPGARLARRIERTTGGRLAVSVHQVPCSGLEAVMTGEADLYYGTEHQHLTFAPAFAYFAGLPYFCGLDPQDLMAWLTIGGGQLLWDDLAAEHGVKALLAGHTGRAPGLWSTSPVNNWSDLAGQRVYVMGLARDVLRSLDVQPTHVPSAELPAALAEGGLLAAEWGGAYASMALGLPQVARHHVGLGINTSGTALSLGIRRTLWERLDAGDQAIIEACAAEELQTSLGEARAHEAAVRHALVTAHDVSFESMPGSIMTRISEASDSVVADLGASSRTARRIAGSYMAFRRAISGLEPPPADASA